MWKKSQFYFFFFLNFTFFSFKGKFNLKPFYADLDGDLEIFCGSTGDFVSIDMKNNGGVSEDYWSIFKGDYARTGYYISGEIDECSSATPGDINYDSIINVLDIVRLVNIVINPLSLTDVEACAADLNDDDIINVLDIVMLVNIVINGW